MRFKGVPRTWIGRLAREKPHEAGACIVEAFERANGKLIVAARSFGITRRHLQRLVWYLELWEEVEAARDRARARGGLPPELGLARLAARAMIGANDDDDSRRAGNRKADRSRTDDSLGARRPNGKRSG